MAMEDRSIERQQIESRLTELETKVSYQDHVIGELNDVVTRQQQQLDQLEKEILCVRNHLKQTVESSLAHADEETPPPHY